LKKGKADETTDIIHVPDAKLPGHLRIPKSSQGHLLQIFDIFVNQILISIIIFKL